MSTKLFCFFFICFHSNLLAFHKLGEQVFDRKELILDESVLWVVSGCDLTAGQIRQGRVEILVRSHQEVNEWVVMVIFFLDDRLDVLQGVDRLKKVTVFAAPITDIGDKVSKKSS